jgi:hypothetical protein
MTVRTVAAPDTTPAIADSATVYVTVTGSDSNNGRTWATAKATIPAAIAALYVPLGVTSPTGNVELGAGVFNVTSYGRAVTPSTTSGTAVISDAAASSADVGAYVIGLNFAAGTQISTVTPGVSYTVSPAPIGTSSVVGIFITKPAFLRPAGVKINGRGYGYSQLTNPVSGATFAAATKFPAATIVQDNGTGATSMIVGDLGANSGNASTVTCRMSNVSIRGNSSNLCGLLTNWAAWLVDDDHVEYSDHAGAGIVMGSYLNNSKLTDCIIRRNGSATATVPCGGILMDAGNGGQNATFQLNNCLIGCNYGTNLAAGSPWPAAYGYGAAYSVTTYGGNIFTAYATTLTGATGPVNAWLGAGVSQNATCGQGTFFGGSYFALKTSGQVVLVSCEITGPGNTFGIYMAGPGLTLIGCVLGGNTIGASVFTNGNSIAWINCKCGDTSWINHGGTVIPVSAATGIGSIGTPTFTLPPAPTSVPLTSGTAWQNTTGGDVILAVPASFAAAGDSVAVARGSTSTPAALGTITRAAGATDVMEYYVPALWYFKATLGGTATFTANATAQPV